jgi:hypothetical protein
MANKLTEVFWSEVHKRVRFGIDHVWCAYCFELREKPDDPKPRFVTLTMSEARELYQALKKEFE